MGLLDGSGLGGNLITVFASAIAAPTTFDFQVTTTAANQTYSWQIAAGTGVAATTDWGDGTTSTHNATGIFTNTYAAAGVYTVKLGMSFSRTGSINLRPNTDRTRLTALLSPIPSFSGLTSLSTLLNNCSELTGSIPTDFLRYVTSVTTFFSLLNGCTKLRIQPDILGPSPSTRFLNQSPSFTNAFRNCGISTGTAQGTAPELWTLNYGTGTPTTSNCFFGNSATNLSNWASIPTAWGGPL